MARKKDKLYTANKWNQPLFAKGVDRVHQNIFDGMFSSTLNTPTSLSSTSGLFQGNSGLNYQTPQLTQPNTSMPIDWSNAGQRIQATQGVNAMVNNFGSDAANNNPFSQYLTSNASGSGSAGKVAALQALKGVGLELAGTIGKSEKNKRGLWDAADPIHQLAGGRESTVGNALGDAGVSVFKAGAQSGNGMMMLGGAALKVAGGLGNAAFGIKTDKERLNNINAGVESLKNFSSNASSFDEIQGPNAIVNNTAGVYKGGWFSGGRARRKNEKLNRQVAQAESWANRSVDNNIDNIAKTQMDNMAANYAAMGGFLDTGNNMSAINYNFMSDYLTAKSKAAESKNRIPSNVFGNLAVTPLTTFALGGDMQTNGSDWSDGLTVIGAGGSHEQNPYQGVQVGISRENGKPNLAEEGETIFDDYVFPVRIKPDAKAKKKFHVSKNSDMSYADLSKKIAKESEERPNDAISQAGLKKQLHELADELERQKEEQQKAEMEAAFAQLPPEQQQALMQQVAMQEQQAQQQQMQGGQPIEESMIQGQQEPQQMVDENMQGQMSPQLESNEQINACGGKMNRFDKGGDMKKKIYSLLGLHTDSDFDQWAYDQKVDKITDWENILKNKQFLDALSGSNPILSDVISRGYDFGTYVPSNNNKLTFDFKHGGWGLEDYNAWNGSTDAAWQEAVKKGLVKEGMNSEEIGKALSQTDAYKRGSDWLKADEGNRLTYLQSILNSEDAPKAARDYAAKYVDANGWLKDAKRDYQTIFEDPNGTGVRNTHPGTYWKTPDEMLRDKQSGNFVMNDDGTIEEIYGDVPKDWTNADNYSWQDDKNDYTYNYYKRPTASADGTATDGNGKNKKILAPNHKPTWGRYAGLFGPAVGLGMQLAGIGKPDYSRMDAAVEASSGAPALAQTKYLGNYLRYNPMDIWYEQNRLNANSRATDRAILNNASPLGTKMAGLLANGYNNQLASGNLYRQALEYNDALRQKVAEFNRGTDQFNAQAFNDTSKTNAQLQNNHRNFKAQMMMDAARQRMASDAAWNQGIYGNVQGLFKGLSDWGKENAQHNMIADMAADGIFGNMSDSQNIGKDYLTTKKVKKANGSTKAARGGRIDRKKGRRGLTF